MPATLPARRLRAGMRASSTSTTRLAFSSTTPVSTMLPYVTMAMSSRMLMTAAAASSSGPRPPAMPSTSFSIGTGATRSSSSSRIDPGGRRPLLHGDQLDGSGDDGAQTLVGFATPRQLPAVDHEHVDVLVADGLLGGGHVVVAVHPHGDIDGVALVGHDAGQLGGSGAGETDVSGDGARCRPTPGRRPWRRRRGA